MKLSFLSVLFILSFLLLSCKNPFAPILADENAPHSKLITQQKTPEEVLSNFQYAYTFRDSLIYSEVLDSTFLYKSVNYEPYPPEPILWGRDTELRTAGGMFRYFRTLDVVWNTISAPDSSEWSSGIIKHFVTFTLTLDGGQEFAPLNGEVEFKFILRDGKFYISFWEDLKT
jgi:hypothetical protein